MKKSQEFFLQNSKKRYMIYGKKIKNLLIINNTILECVSDMLWKDGDDCHKRRLEK